MPKNAKDKAAWLKVVAGLAVVVFTAAAGSHVYPLATGRSAGCVVLTAK